MYKLLIVDDNVEIQAANLAYFTRRGYDVDAAYSSAEAFARIAGQQYHCIVLDVMLPDLDGYTFLKAARRTIDTPVIYLSCLDGEDDRVRGLMAGGDDYMTKPYSLRELAARIHAQIRRDKAFSQRDGDIRTPAPNVLVDPESRALIINGTSLVLSKKECAMLSLLVSKPNALVSRDDLLRCAEGEEASLPVYVKRIRDKLAQDQSLGEIVTVHGEGYQYRPARESGDSR